LPSFCDGFGKKEAINKMPANSETIIRPFFFIQIILLKRANIAF
jgi:hypothetical protein